MKVARLAVDVTKRGMGTGYYALQFAVYVAQAVRDYSVVVFLTLDCYEHRVSYYERFGFRRNICISLCCLIMIHL